MMLKDQWYIDKPSGAIAQMERRGGNINILFTLHHVIGKETKVLWGSACNIWMFDKQAEIWVRLPNSQEIFYEGKKYMHISGSLLTDIQTELKTAVGKSK